jgi:hypothetical protein
VLDHSCRNSLSVGSWDLCLGREQLRFVTKKLPVLGAA